VLLVSQPQQVAEPVGGSGSSSDEDTTETADTADTETDGTDTTADEGSSSTTDGTTTDAQSDTMASDESSDGSSGTDASSTRRGGRSRPSGQEVHQNEAQQEQQDDEDDDTTSIATSADNESAASSITAALFGDDADPSLFRHSRKPKPTPKQEADKETNEKQTSKRKQKAKKLVKTANSADDVRAAEPAAGTGQQSAPAQTIPAPFTRDSLNGKIYAAAIDGKLDQALALLAQSPTPPHACALGAVISAHARAGAMKAGFQLIKDSIKLVWPMRACAACVICPDPLAFCSLCVCSEVCQSIVWQVSCGFATTQGSAA
jgi:hypothetical protein